MVERIKDHSGMSFIVDNTFHIECSDLHHSIADKNIRTVEFVRVRDDELLFVEAKSSFVNPNNPNTENPYKFDEEIAIICKKFKHSLALFASSYVGAINKEFPDDFVLPEQVKLVFILVIKNHKLAWCKPIQSAIMDTFPPYLKTIWKPEVRVYDYETATEYGLTYR